MQLMCLFEDFMGGQSPLSEPRTVSRNAEMYETAPILCSRCLKTLMPGRGELYVITIEAIADPTPPEITAGDLGRNYRADWREIVAALKDTSPQEALDQIYRRLIIHLCNTCYRAWIENPTG
jgi:hypothetical protein